MSGDDSKRKNGLEVFKATSTFISSVIIAATGIFLTFQYNANQLQISRNRELADLIPKLGSPDVNIRKFSAISLSLYEKNAIHPLTATLDDENQDVRAAAANSLALIGKDAIPALTKIYEDRHNASSQRAMALYTLGQIRAPQAYDLAASALDSSREDPIVRKDAATVMGFLKDKRSVGRLFSVLKKSKEKDALLLISCGRWEKCRIYPTRTTLSLCLIIPRKRCVIKRCGRWQT